MIGAARPSTRERIDAEPEDIAVLWQNETAESGNIYRAKTGGDSSTFAPRQSSLTERPQTSRCRMARPYISATTASAKTRLTAAKRFKTAPAKVALRRYHLGWSKRTAQLLLADGEKRHYSH